LTQSYKYVISRKEIRTRPSRTKEKKGLEMNILTMMVVYMVLTVIAAFEVGAGVRHALKPNPDPNVAAVWIGGALITVMLALFILVSTLEVYR